MEAFDASANKRIAHGRVSASWSHEATAPTSEFPDKYRARTSWTYQAEASFSPNVLTSELFLNSRETE